MTIKSVLLSFVLALTLLGSHTIQVVHDAVHPFHAHLVSDTVAEHTETQHTSGHPKQTHSIEPWLCDLFDAFSHSKAAVSQVFDLDFTPDLQPGLVAIYPILAQASRYHAFQSRAPPIAFSV
ncbi:hypothetical protein JX580_11145 [Thiomicrospira microaerophila]|uniref:hypothetical protein n=1 Tax=Thiomicrospira microaerophila TaxID=406020 RepID=UPI0020105A18|nr:hypothetical protein [Thiomicrospira microaerophila]UQB42194.1 hypothetical protein JX580_11145 [Thiomicrospira microaerophila]